MNEEKLYKIIMKAFREHHKDKGMIIGGKRLAKKLIKKILREFKKEVEDEDV